MNIIKDIKQLAVDGNVVSVAIGVVLGNALSTVATSFMANIIVPILMVFYAACFGDHTFTISFSMFGSPTNTIMYGAFLKSLFDLIISACAILFVIKHVNAVMNSFDPVIKLCPFCCAKIPVKAVKCQQCSSELPKAE